VKTTHRGLSEMPKEKRFWQRTYFLCFILPLLPIHSSKADDGSDKNAHSRPRRTQLCCAYTAARMIDAYRFSPGDTNYKHRTHVAFGTCCGFLSSGCRQKGRSLHARLRLRQRCFRYGEESGIVQPRHHTHEIRSG
jgi:hypothetical protein